MLKCCLLEGSRWWKCLFCCHWSVSVVVGVENEGSCFETSGDGLHLGAKSELARVYILSQLVVRGQLKCIAVTGNKRHVAITSRDCVKVLCVLIEFQIWIQVTRWRQCNVILTIHVRHFNEQSIIKPTKDLKVKLGLNTEVLIDFQMDTFFYQDPQWYLQWFRVNILTLITTTILTPREIPLWEHLSRLKTF